MKPTIAVMSYGVLTSLIEKNKNKLPKSNLVDIEIINVPHYESLIIAQEMEKKQKADVFISFGNSLLSRYIKSPVVEIKATEFDVFMALHKAKKRSDIVVIITHINNKIIYLKEISDMFKFTIKQYTYDNNNEVEGILKQVINQGIHSVICTGYVYEIAQKLENRTYINIFRLYRNKSFRNGGKNRNIKEKRIRKSRKISDDYGFCS